MKTMTIALTAWVLLSVATLAARDGVIKGEAAVKHPAAAQAAAEKWKGIAEVKPIDSPRLKALFGDAGLYCVAVRNPRAAIAGRPTFLHTMIMSAGETFYVESDDEAAALLSKKIGKPAGGNDALNVALAFADLRNYVVETDHSVAVAPDEAVPAEWRIVTEKAANGWTVHYVLMTDPTIRRYVRYTLTIDSEGTVTATPGKVVSMAGGYW